MAADLFSPPQAVDHSCLACGHVHTPAREVRLADGAVVSSYSEAWRLECEALGILDMPELWRRQKRLREIEARRGVEAADALRARMMAIWNASKQEIAA